MDSSKSTSTETFDIIAKGFLYIALFPTFLGLLFAKLSNRLLIKSTIDFKYRINSFRYFITKIILFIFILAIFLAGLGYSLTAVIHTKIIWQIIIYAIAINISLVAFFGAITILIHSINLINLTIKGLKHQDIVEIKKTVVKKEKEKKLKIYWKFFINLSFIDKYIESLVLKQNIDKMKTGDAGVVLNAERSICISPYALNRGTVVFGTTGSGKTNTLELFIKYGISKHQNIIFVNGKGDENLIKDLRAICENNNYQLKIWAPSLAIKPENKFIYNPFKNKTADLVTSILMEIGRYSTIEENVPGAIYYKNDEMACISLLCKSLLWKQKNKKANDNENYGISLETLFKYSDIEKLNILLEGNTKQNELNSLSERIEEYKRIRSRDKFHTEKGLLEIRKILWHKDGDGEALPENFLPNANHISNYLNNEIINLAKQCKKIKSTPIVRGDSAYEKLFEEFIDVNRNDDKVKAMSNIRTTFRNLRDITNDEKIIDVSGESLTDVITSDKPTVLLFSLDTKAKKIQSAQVARMLIADLKQNDRVIKENDENNNLMCIFDEFGSFATEDIVELQEQGRSFGFQIIYSIQTLSNLTKISLDFATRIVGNCSTYITHRTRDNKAAEEIANLISTNPSLEATERHSEGEATGEQSVREVQEYIHHPRLIKQLSDHYALIVTVKEGVVTPIKEPIKIDYADVEHFHADDNKEASEYELELSKCFEEEGFSKVKAQKLTKENINQNIQFVSKKGKDVLIAKVYKSSVDDEINKIESMSEKEWDKYREILWLNEYPNKKMDNGWFKNRKLFIEKKLKKHEKTIKEN